MTGRRVAGAARPEPRRRVRRLAVALAAAPLAVVLVGVGHAGETPSVLTTLTLPDDQHPVTGPPAAVSPASPSVPSASPAAPSPAARRSGASSPGRATAPGSGLRGARPSTSGPVRARTAARSAPKAVTAGAEELRDVRYATLSPSQSLDLYLPVRSGRAIPLVIDIHGGAFMGGGKSESRGRIDALLARGYAVASVNYRLSEEAHFPAGVADIKAAVRWLRAAAPRHGLDPTRFAAWGDSAGGYFAVMLGATSGTRTPFDDPALGNPSVSSSVQAVVDFFGPVDFLTMDRQAARPGGCPADPQVHDDAGSPESLWLGSPVPSVPALARSASPLSYLTGQGTPPPFFVAHGTADCLVPQGQSLQLVAALKARRTPYRAVMLSGVGHAGPEFDERLQPEVLAFLDRTLKGA